MLGSCTAADPSAGPDHHVVLQAAQQIQAAIQAAIDKQSKKQAAMSSLVLSATESRQRTELEAALKNEEHKQRQLQQVQQDFAALLAGETS